MFKMPKLVGFFKKKKKKKKKKLNIILSKTLTLDLEKGNALVAELEKKLKASQKLADEREKKCNELTVQLQKEKSGGSESATQSQTLLENNKTMDDLKQKMTLAEDAKHRAEEALKGQKVEINQYI
jgi:hypothetical protein